jgi:hypothetical protein
MQRYQYECLRAIHVGPVGNLSMHFEIVSPATNYHHKLRHHNVVLAALLVDISCYRNVEITKAAMQKIIILLQLERD